MDRADHAADRAGHLRASDTRVIRHIDLLDGPPGCASTEDHLERPTEASIAEVECEQLGAASGAHRTEVAQSYTGAAPDRSCEVPVRGPQVPRPRARIRGARAEHEVAPIIDDGLRDAHQVVTVEGAVTVHERDHFRSGGAQPGEARRAESAPGFVHDVRTHRARDGGGVVGRSVVDNDRVPTTRDRRQHTADGGGFVEHR